MASVDANAAAFLAAIRSARHFSNYAAARRHLRTDQDVNVRGAGGVTALHLAAEIGRLGKVQKLLKERGDANAIDDQGRTPLMVAQFHLHTPIVRYLIEHTQLVRALVSHLGEAPTANQIHAAMFMQRWRAFRERVYTDMKVGGTKLINAARLGDLHLVRSLVEHDEVHIDSVDPQTEETAFSAALAAGSISICDYLLTKGSHAYAPCVVNGEKQSVLLTAVAQGNVIFVRRLLAHGVHRVTVVYDKRSCALAEAVQRGPNAMIDALLEAGIQFDWRNSRHCFPGPAYAVLSKYEVTADNLVWLRLLFACWRQDLQHVKRLFGKHSEFQDLDLMATRGSDALYIAVYQESEEIAMELLARGARINPRVATSSSPMLATVHVDSLRMLQFLIERGGDTSFLYRSYPQETDPSLSLLGMAVYAGAKDCASFFLPLETRPEQRDAAMILAARHYNDAFIHMLLDHGLPSTEVAFQRCVIAARSPVALDLLLTRYCGKNYSMDNVACGFHLSCQQGQAQLVDVYVAHGVDVNALRGSQTALQCAALGMSTYTGDVFKLLVQCGADTLYVDSNEPMGHGVVGAALQRHGLASNTL